MNQDTLEDLKKEAEDISGQWNGKEPGSLEYRALAANEIIEHINEIKSLINYLQEF